MLFKLMIRITIILCLNEIAKKMNEKDKKIKLIEIFFILITI